MVNAKEYKPVINEMIDLFNRQKFLAENLNKKILATEEDEKFLSAMKNYLEKLNEQIEALEKVSRMMQISIESDDFKKLEARK